MTVQEFRDVQPLLSPRAVAVVGASQRVNRGTRVVENLLRFGFGGDIFVVNPKYDDVLGVPCVASVSDLPVHVDLIVVAVGADAALSVLADAGAHGIKGAVVIGSGFGEGGVGVDRADQLKEIVETNNMVLCGPNCYGALNTHSGAAAYSGRIVTPLVTGNVALVLQSGALTHAITDSALGRGFGISAVVTSGNELSATISDYIRFYADDESTDVIGVFVEGLRDADKFADACRRARANGKSVVVLSTGRSEIGRKAAMAHTGAIAGGSAALDGLLYSVGAVRVEDLDEFRETLLLFSQLKRSQSHADGIAAVSISGGASGLMADTAETLDVRLAQFGDQTREQLKKALPDFAAVNNPLDVTGAASENSAYLSDSLALASADEDVALVAFAMNVGQTDDIQSSFYRAQADIVAAAAGSAAGPMVLLTLTAGALDEEIRNKLSAAGVPVVMGLRAGMKAIKSWLLWPSLVPSAPRQVGPAKDWPFAEAVVPGVAAMQELSDAGVRVAPFGHTTDPAGVKALVEEIGVPVVLKIESPDIAHKSEAGGVRLNLKTPEQAEQAARKMLADVAAREPDARIAGFMAQTMVQGETLEVLVGVVRDPQVGLIVSVAPGGVLAELLGPAATWPVPATREDIEYLVGTGALTALLDGYRGGARLDKSALVDAVLAVSDLAATLPDLAALEINPLLVRPVGQGVVAVDALFIRN